MSLLNLAEDFLYQRLPQGLIELDERYLIQAVVGGYQDRLEDLRSYAKKFELFFSSAGLPETGPNVVLVDLTTSGGKTFTRSLDIAATTPTDTTQLASWAAGELGVDVSAVSNARLGTDPLRTVDASILDYLATNIGAVLYKSAVAENQPTVITQSGTFTATQLAHQRLIETYFPRLKFKGTARSFEALGKLLGFDDVRLAPLWGRVSPRLPNDPGSSVNDQDFSETPEFWPQQEIGPFYNPLDQADGPFYSWPGVLMSGTVSNGTAATNFYTQRVNGFQPWVRVDVLHGANGTVTHPAAGTYVLAGGAPHQKASVAAGTDLQFTALGEGDSWNGINVQVSAWDDGTLRRLDITDRLSSIKYRTSYYDLGITMDADKADAVFGTLTTKTNRDIAPLPGQATAQPYVSFGGTLYGTSPFRPFTAGSAAFRSVTGIDRTDFLTPFAGTIVAYTERREAGLGDYQQNYAELASAGQLVTQALEEVRPATRSPRRASYGYLQKDTVGYAPIQAEECFAIVASGSQLHQFNGTLLQAPLPPYTTQVVFRGTAGDYPLGAETTAGDPTAVYYHLESPGTVTGKIVLAGTGTGSYSFTTSGAFSQPGTLCAEFYGTIGENNWPDTHEVVRPDAFVGTQTFAVIGDYGLASHYPGPAQDVANLVHSWNPEILITTGDNNYYSGQASTIANNNKGYWDYIQQGRMFPSLGNHDLVTDNGDIQITYFFNGTAPGNGRYYNVRRGNVEFFALNPGWTGVDVGLAIDDPNYTPTHEPDGNSFTSIQGQWLKDALARSTAQWKIVYFHFPPYTSSTSSNDYSPGYPRMRWPFREWGATAVFNGHVHAYERLIVDNFPYFVVGFSGEDDRLYDNFYVSPGSQVRYSTVSTNYGAIRITATDQFIRFDAVLRTGEVIDSYQVNAEEKRYMPRPEDQLDDDLIFETVDEYPYRRDIVGGGELIEMDFSIGSAGVVSILEQTMAVKDQTGAEHNVYVVKSPSSSGPRFVIQPRSTTAYKPGQRAIAFRGQFRDQASLGPDDTDLFARPGGRTRFFHSDLDNVLQPGYALYHAGIVNGVLVADADRFNGESHRRGLAGWLPFNEHPDDDLAVADVALSSAQQTVIGLAPYDREFDASHGRYLHLRAQAGLMSSAARGCYDDFAISFWVKCEAAIDLEDEYVISFGGVRFNMDLSTKIIASNVLDADGTTWHPVWNASASDWVFVYLSKTATKARFGWGSLLTPSSEASLTGNFAANTGEDFLLINAAERAGFFIRDLRIWNVSKTAAELDAVRNYQPTPTVVPYRIGHVLALNDGDRYALQVLNNGWLAPSNMPAWVRSPKFAKVIKYDGHGEFDAEPWRKEVGLGGGQIPPTTWQLGYQYHNLTAAGTTVAAPALGASPGVNPFWLADATGAPGNYIQVSGSIAIGAPATVQNSGTAVPWPNQMVATNPVVDQIWLTDDQGHVYRCYLESGPNYSAHFVAQPGTLSNQEQGDALVLLAGTNQTLGVTGYGSVVQKAYAGTQVTPPLFMYLNDVLLEDVGGSQALARWTDPTVFGISHGAPALKSNGELSFTNTATLLAGIFKLKLDVGNIGKVDDEFDGFRLDITIGDYTINKTLLQGVKGSDFRGQEEIEFTLDHDIVGDWLLTLSWLNAYTDPIHGTARQLIVYGYSLRRLETNLYQVTLAAAGTTPVLYRYPDLHAPNWQQVPGGWLLTYNSYGTVVATAHEGTVYPHNDTLPRSRYPLANLLTGRTADRREDVIVTSAQVVLTDLADPVIAPFGGGLSVT